MAANLVPLLQACSSGQRSVAEAALAKSEAADTTAFMLACAEVLRDRTLSPHIRSLAAILLKNAIGAREVTRSRELALRWQAVDANSKALVRHAMIDALSDPTQKDVRRAAALCIARAGMVDIPAGAWPQIVPSLMALIETTGTSPEISSSALWSIGLIAEEWTFYHPKESEYAEIADQFFTITMHALQQPSQLIRAAAASSLGQLMQWTIYRQKRDNPAETAELFRIVLQSCAPSEAEDLKIEALKCLAECVRFCYSHMKPALEQLSLCTLAAMGSTSESLVLASVDVWKTIAEKERRLEYTHKQKSSSSIHTQAVYHQIVRLAQAAIMPALLDVLVRGARDSVDDEDGSNLMHITAECLREVGLVIGDDSVILVRSFFDQNACASSFHRHAALVALGSIQPKTSDDAIAKLVEGSMPFLIEALQSGSSGFAASAAWAAGAIAENHLAVLPLGTQENIYLLCLQKLSVNSALTVQVCYCLEMLVVKQVSKMPLSIFQDIMEKLQSAARSATSDRARAALLSTLGEMCRLAGDDYLVHIAPLLPRLLSWAAGADGRLVDGVAACLETLTLRLKAQHVAPVAEQMLEVYFRNLQAHFTAHGCLDADTLRAIGALATVLGPQFAGAMPKVWPVLQKALKDIDEPDICIAGLAAFHEVTTALGSAVQPYVVEILEIAFNGLRSRGLDMRLRMDFIGCIGDITLAMGAALPSLPEVLRTLGDEVAYIHERESEIASEASSGKDHGKVIDLLLRAYDAVVSSSEGALLALKDFITGVLEFVCCFARSMQLYATNLSWNMGISLVGKIALAFPQDLASLASKSPDVQDMIKKMHQVSCETPNEFGGALVRPFSGPLGTVLQASSP